MNKSTFQVAQQSYEKQDFASALESFQRVLSDTEFPLQTGDFGLIYHQIGNCYVKLQNYPEAINAYTNACSDASYVSIGTVYFNLGMAYAYMNDFGNAIRNFQTAIDTPNYRSKHKAYTAMGNALMKSGKSADAAAAFRSAAMDNSNPNPTRALLNLGVCFMALNRPKDAVTVYENAYQYNMPDEFKNRLNANMGQAYVACGQMEKAIKAFEDSLRDKTYKLSDSASVDYQRAIAAISHGDTGQNESMADNPFEVTQNFNNDPQQAFASDNANEAQPNLANNDLASEKINEPDQFEKWTQSAKDAAQKKKVKKHPIKIILVIFLFLIAACIIAGSVFYCLGFGFPSQEMIAKDYFANPIEAKDKVFDDSLNDSQKNNYCSMINTDPNAEVLAVTRSVNDSTAYVSASSGKGMKLTYKIKMTRYLVS